MFFSHLFLWKEKSGALNMMSVTTSTRVLYFSTTLRYLYCIFCDLNLLICRLHEAKVVYFKIHIFYLHQVEKNEIKTLFMNQKNAEYWIQIKSSVNTYYRVNIHLLLHVLSDSFHLYQSNNLTRYLHFYSRQTFGTLCNTA